MNSHLSARLDGLTALLRAAGEASDDMDSNNKGFERELVVQHLLRDVFPPTYRFGTGVVIDADEGRSGQIDIVVEYPHLPSIPITSAGPRLYLQEGVCAAIEVKSNVSKQWHQVEKTAEGLAGLGDRSYPGGIRAVRQYPLRDEAVGVRDDGSRYLEDSAPPPFVPLFVVAYGGWAKPSKAANRMHESRVDGIFVLHPGDGDAYFVSQEGAFTGASAILMLLAQLSDLSRAWVGGSNTILNPYLG